MGRPHVLSVMAGRVPRGCTHLRTNCKVRSQPGGGWLWCATAPRRCRCHRRQSSGHGVTRGVTEEDRIALRAKRLKLPDVANQPIRCLAPENAVQLRAILRVPPCPLDGGRCSQHWRQLAGSAISPPRLCLRLFASRPIATASRLAGLHAGRISWIARIMPSGRQEAQPRQIVSEICACGRASPGHPLPTVEAQMAGTRPAMTMGRGPCPAHCPPWYA
jgi:hypothetical protein